MMIVGSDAARDARRLDDLLAVARQHQAALVLALRVGDDVVGMIATSRLRLALRRATELLESAAAHDPATHAALVANFNEAMPALHRLLRRAPRRVANRGDTKWIRWAMSMKCTDERQGPHVFELDASGRHLQDARFFGLRVARSRFITDMRRASFVDAFIETTDFTYSNLRDTLWRNTHVQHSFFRDSVLSNAAFDDARFTDCDFRDADLRMDSLALTATGGATFVRCDLRGARWDGRSGSSIALIDCKTADSVGLKELA